MSIKKPRNKERRSLKAVMQGGVARGEKRETRMKSFVKLCHGNSNDTRAYTHTHTHTHTHISTHTHAHPVQSY